MNKLIYMLLIVFVPAAINAQNVGIGTSTPDPSAILQLESTTKGLLVPAMTTANRIAIASPAAGLLVYDYTTKSFWVFSSAAWHELITDATRLWSTNGVEIYNDINRVGIGTNTPNTNAQLDIKGTNKGLLIPRGNAATRTALNSNTAKGLLVCDTVTNTIWIHNGNGLASGWQSLSAGTNYWQQAGAGGNEIQNINTGGFWSANPTTVEFNPASFTAPVSGAGTRLMWMPKKAAFRAGSLFDDISSAEDEGTFWNADSIGLFSFAAGADTKATGEASTAFGVLTKASGQYSTAFGAGSSSIGNYATATGLRNVAIGDGSFVTGSENIANGTLSTATGFQTRTDGFFSTTMGTNTIARAYAALSIGQYNDRVLSSSLTNWVNTDPLLIVGNGTSESNRHNAMVIYKNGNMVLKNPLTVSTPPSGFTVPVSGAGTRLMWLPEKSAFRAGTVTEGYWDADSIGMHSVAFGYNSRAVGDWSTAMGYSARAWGDNSASIGYVTTASGAAALALGSVTNASGGNATTMGSRTIASGTTSTAMGFSTIASGNYAISQGFYTTARSYGSLSLGRYNDSIASSNPDSWVASDPLLILGNGTSANLRHNALVIYKNGNTDITGFTQLGEAAPAIKIKKFTLNTPGTQGAFAFIAHGLTQSKIISITGLVEAPGGFQIIPNHEQAGFKYTLNIDNANIAVGTVAGNSASILSKPIKIVVIYEE